MRFTSTRATEPASTSLSRALCDGLAPDGGLFVPSQLPHISKDDAAPLQEIAHLVLGPFLQDDALQDALPEIIKEAFSFPIPLRRLEENTALLELFHGPTAAFKDVGARFLASCLQRINQDASRPLTVLVATSGDTGGAVAAAFWKKTNIEVFVLYPEGRVSGRQEKQLITWGDNISAFRVAGDFDDCQHLVKAAFADPSWRKQKRLSSANSINIGRLLPQATYYAWASLAAKAMFGRAANFVVPTGNLGNALACIWARAMGFPINQVHLATNANDTIPRLMHTGEVSPNETIPTLASAMDVSKPSNLERLLHLYPDLETLKRFATSSSVNDEAIRSAISSWGAQGIEVCPHTACALIARQAMDDAPAVVVATAHPAKFEGIVEPLIRRTVDLPKALSQIISKEGKSERIEPSLEDFSRAALST